MHPPRKLTERFIDGLAFNGKAYAVRDTKTVGFFVQVNARSKSYKVQHDLWRDGRKVKTVRKTLGRTDQLTLAQARARAQELMGQIRQGIDPNENHRRPRGIWNVEEMFAAHQEALRIRGRAERTIEDVGRLVKRYFTDWADLPIDQITKAHAHELHGKITRGKNGQTPRKVAANKALQAFGAAYRHAEKRLDAALPTNPVRGVEFHRIRVERKVILLEDLPDWWARIQVLPNPLRREMHTLGLFSGLRPGTLVSLRREWINLEKQVISIPNMKSGQPFDLPLSQHMVSVVRRAIEVGDMLHSGSEWLFPTRIRDGRITHVQVWKERTVPETGHILRHTYRTIAQHVGLDLADARLLMHHKLPGIESVYVHQRALFTRLLQAQERMTAAILELLEAD